MKYVIRAETGYTRKETLNINRTFTERQEAVDFVRGLFDRVWSENDYGTYVSYSGINKSGISACINILEVSS